MSYNIDRMKVRSLQLVFPKDEKFFEAWLAVQPAKDAQGFKNVGVQWCREEGNVELVLDYETLTWHLNILEKTLSGIITDDGLVTTMLYWQGESSGQLYTNILLPLFQTYTGSISALVVWECGDSVRELTITDGVILEKEIE